MNRIEEKLSETNKLLSVYFTAGYPKLNDTLEIIRSLEKSGVGMVEIGLPFSDPLADGPVIQQSSSAALNNGMNSQLLFEQLKDIRKEVEIPLLIMGYFNPILQFGVEKFCEECKKIGIDGLIIPDLPLEEFQQNYQDIFLRNELLNIFLIAPQTSEKRIREIDEAAKGFIYMVSSSATTGKTDGFGEEQKNYFKRIHNMNLKNKKMVGFGVKDKKSFEQVTELNSGGIIGSAFVKFLSENGVNKIESFVREFH